jgi:hypothetical protein
MDGHIVAHPHRTSLCNTVFPLDSGAGGGNGGGGERALCARRSWEKDERRSERVWTLE